MAFQYRHAGRENFQSDEDGELNSFITKIFMVVDDVFEDRD